MFTQSAQSATSSDLSGTVLPLLNGRDRAVLRAVAAGRCRLSGPNPYAGSLTVDGVYFSDQFAGPRLVDAGLIEADGQGSGPRPLSLTGAGRAALLAA